MNHHTTLSIPPILHHFLIFIPICTICWVSCKDCNARQARNIVNQSAIFQNAFRKEKHYLSDLIGHRHQQIKARGHYHSGPIRSFIGEQI